MEIYHLFWEHGSGELSTVYAGSEEALVEDEVSRLGRVAIYGDRMAAGANTGFIVPTDSYNEEIPPSRQWQFRTFGNGKFRGKSKSEHSAICIEYQNKS